MPVIEVHNLRKTYGAKTAVEDVSFTVEQGEIFGILGPNGAGKTTTVECIEGLRKPDGGSVSVLGLDPIAEHARVAHVLGVQLQEAFLPEKMKLREAIELYASFYDEPADGTELMEVLGIADVRETRFKKLSGGQKQRLSIALALIGSPSIVVLDELTTGLDPAGRRDTWALIERVRDRGVTVVLVTHFMEEAERLCDRLAIIDKGTVVAIDSPAGLVSRVEADQIIRFRPSTPIDDALLADLPEVTSVTHAGPQIVVTGGVDVLQAVVGTLARHQVVAADLRVEQTSLDDAFVALTGKKLEPTEGAR